jgi:aconitate hydratase
VRDNNRGQLAGEKMDTVADQIIKEHIIEGRPEPGENIAIKIDQTLTQDATGTLAYLELAAIGIDQIKTELSVSYVDHNLSQTDNKNADDHLSAYISLNREMVSVI